MLGFVAKRLVGMVAVMFAASVLVFLIFNVVPNSDPAEQLAGKGADNELVEKINHDWGFDQSLPSQYLAMMGKTLDGTLVSYQTQVEVDDEIVSRIPITVSLVLGAAVIWLTVALLFGYLSAANAGRLSDRALTVLAVLGISLPAFWLAAILLYFLAFKTSLFPVGDYVGFLDNPLQWAYHLVLPWITLAVLLIGFYSRLLRANMLDAMGQEHVRVAYSKGLTARQVRTRHVLLNSLVPLIALLGLDLGAMIGGSAILVETVFNLPGVGAYASEAIANLDLPPLMALTLFGAFTVVLINTIAEIAQARLDPRVQLGGPSR